MLFLVRLVQFIAAVLGIALFMGVVWAWMLIAYAFGY